MNENQAVGIKETYYGAFKSSVDKTDHIAFHRRRLGRMYTNKGNFMTHSMFGSRTIVEFEGQCYTFDNLMSPDRCWRIARAAELIRQYIVRRVSRISNSVYGDKLTMLRNWGCAFLTFSAFSNDYVDSEIWIGGCAEEKNVLAFAFWIAVHERFERLTSADVLPVPFLSDLPF
jgi:hypothetical protein